MKVTAVTQDQVILVDGVPVDVRKIGGYHMTNGEWAVHFDTETGLGHIEYTDNRDNELLGSAKFEQSYQWLVSTHQQVLDYDAEQQALADSAHSDDSGTTV